MKARTRSILTSMLTYQFNISSIITVRPRTTSSYMNHPCASTARRARMPSKMTAPPHTTPCLAKIALIPFVLAVIGYAIGLMSRELHALGVEKIVLIDGYNVFKNGLNSNALSPNTTNTNNNISNFTDLYTGIALNNNIKFDLTAVSLASPVPTIIRIEFENKIYLVAVHYNYGQVQHNHYITSQPALVFSNTDNELLEFDVLGYVYHASLAGIGFDWDVSNILHIISLKFSILIMHYWNGCLNLILIDIVSQQHQLHHNVQLLSKYVYS